ncbi:MAG: dihydroxyacetone kinase subunit L [Anaerolineaceae bacterium]|nr:dihydroxyacetone kinase subunit L [Anaerolineaceae bacterium]
MVKAISTALSDSKSDLNALDSELGDGDHGTTICAGFAAAVNAIEEAQTPSEVLQKTAMTLMNRMGGSSGALFGTLFLRAAMTVKEFDDVSSELFGAMWQAGLEGVISRGKAQPGDKTMVDALSPAVASLAQASTAGTSLGEALRHAASAAADGAQATANMQAKYGRARYVGERAVGHVDAGAKSIALMFGAMADYWAQMNAAEEDSNGEA